MMGQMIWLSCEGENPADKENIGAISYYPYPGFPTYHYPYEKQKDYLSPAVFAHLKNPKRKLSRLRWKQWDQMEKHFMDWGFRGKKPAYQINRNDPVYILPLTKAGFFHTFPGNTGEVSEKLSFSENSLSVGKIIVFSITFLEFDREILPFLHVLFNFWTFYETVSQINYFYFI